MQALLFPFKLVACVVALIVMAPFVALLAALVAVFR